MYDPKEKITIDEQKVIDDINYRLDQYGKSVWEVKKFYEETKSFFAKNKRK